MMVFDCERFKVIRSEKKLSQREIALAIGKSSYRTILRWEKGINTPSEAEIRLLAQLLCVSVSEISSLEDIENNPYYYESLSSLDRNIIDFSSKTETEKQGLLMDLKNRNKILRLQNLHQEKEIGNLNTIINSLEFLIYRKNIKHKFLFVNKSFLYYFGLSYESFILGARNEDIWKGNNRWNELVLLEKKVLETNIAIINEKIRLPKALGPDGTGLISIKPVFDKDGKTIEIIGRIRDISAEESGKNRYHYMEFAMDDLDHTIWISKIKPRKHLIYINKAAEALFGIERSQFYKNTDSINSFIHKDDLKIFENCLKENHSDINIRICLKNGIIRWINYYYCQTVIDGEEFELGIIKDITLNRQNYETINLLTAALDNSPFILIVFDKEYTKYIFASKSFEKIYGYSLKEMTEDIDFWLEVCVHPDDRALQSKYISGEIEWPAKNEFRIVRKDGRILNLISYIYIVDKFIVIYSLNVTKNSAYSKLNSHNL
jgi:PAS domain S-box-containing protein